MLDKLLVKINDQMNNNKKKNLKEISKLKNDDLYTLYNHTKYIVNEDNGEELGIVATAIIHKVVKQLDICKKIIEDCNVNSPSDLVIKVVYPAIDSIYFTEQLLKLLIVMFLNGEGEKKIIKNMENSK